MFAALLYKEYREHRSIWLALAFSGVAVVFGVPLLYQPPPGQVPIFHEMLAVTVVILAWAYGVVCGAMLLAGEREGGTQKFLDMLPTSRLPLWLAKCIIGGLLVSQLLTLFTTPIVYLTLDRLAERRRARKERRAQARLRPALAG